MGLFNISQISLHFKRYSVFQIIINFAFQRFRFIKYASFKSLVPESTRWIVVKGRREQAATILRLIARRNNRLSKNQFCLMKMKKQKELYKECRSQLSVLIFEFWGTLLWSFSTGEIIFEKETPNCFNLYNFLDRNR